MMGKQSSIKNIIRYNSVAKEPLNSIYNPRLLQAISNLVIIDITDEDAYNYFMDTFVDGYVKKSLSTKKDKKRYSHEVIIFENEDTAIIHKMS
ncbi:hypothetical protein [Moritella sp. Urea-trap-13]|uniref:hypothetical protein n=1 Tax=Moritella sp. Urea-trap-13 TaxID=2058327 RepID=UPI000C3212B8|nr:hypothetical protein [Moritella sp. Urea-trap-13]PKH05238.1 hypothetical protein CXF93_18265 [Moritella sp. Urea-trap-13]